MAILPEIINRKSPVVFKSKNISKAQLDELIEAARWAPSGFNNQPWNYVFVSKTDKNRKAVDKSLMPGNSWAIKAPYLVVVGSSEDLQRSNGGIQYFVYDTALSMMNFSLQAEHLGLRVHQMGGFFGEKARKAVEYPANYKVIVIAALGYEEKSSSIRDRLNEKIRQKLAKPRTRLPPEKNFFFGKFKNNR